MDPVPCPDVDLLRRFRENGDRQAPSLLFERHRGLAYRLALGVLRNPADAEDAAQDAFIKLLAYEPRAHPYTSLPGLVAQMAIRSAQNLARSAGRRECPRPGQPTGRSDTSDRSDQSDRSDCHGTGAPCLRTARRRAGQRHACRQRGAPSTDRLFSAGNQLPGCPAAPAHCLDASPSPWGHAPDGGRGHSPSATP